MNCYGVVAYTIYTGSTNGERYQEFIRECILPAAHPYPGRNSIIVHDNASFHRNAELRAMVEATGNALLQLPRYSPDFMPIELLFGWSKKWLRRHRDIMQAAPDTCLVEAFRAVPREHFAQWVVRPESEGENVTSAGVPPPRPAGVPPPRPAGVRLFCRRGTPTPALKTADPVCCRLGSDGVRRGLHL